MIALPPFHQNPNTLNLKEQKKNAQVFIKRWENRRRKKTWLTESETVARLFEMYEELTK